MDELNHYGRIESYEENKLSQAERRQFEQDLKHDEELKLEYDAYMLSKEVSFVLGYEQLKEQKPAKEISIKQKAKTLNLKKWLVAASFLVAIGFTTFWANRSYSNRALALNEFTEINVSSSRTANETNLFIEIKNAFELKEYNKVIDLARRVDILDSNSVETQFIAAHSFIKLGKYANAIPGLKPTASDDNNLNVGNAQWNLALCYVLTEQHQHAVDLLDRIIANPSGDYREKAIELKSKLGAFWRKLII